MQRTDRKRKRCSLEKLDPTGTLAGKKKKANLCSPQASKLEYLGEFDDEEMRDAVTPTQVDFPEPGSQERQVKKQEEPAFAKARASAKAPAKKAAKKKTSRVSKGVDGADYSGGPGASSAPASTSAPVNICGRAKLERRRGAYASLARYRRFSPCCFLVRS